MRRLLAGAVVALVLAGCDDNSTPELPPLDTSKEAKCAELSEDAERALANWQSGAGPFAPERQVEVIVYNNKVMVDLGCPPSDTVMVPSD